MPIERGVNLTDSTNDGFTPRHYACWKGHIDVALMLIKQGASATDNTDDDRLGD